MSVEQRYSVAEASFLLRLRLGPKFGNWYTLLSDQRRGKKTKVNYLRHRGKMKGIPYYLATDLDRFVEDVRNDPDLAGLAETGVKPEFWEYDWAKDISL